MRDHTQAELFPVDRVSESAATPIARERFQRSFLKWAGNKFQILSEILRVLPPGQRLVEPFAGSGVVFLNAKFARNLVCDSNPALVDTFAAIKSDVERFVLEGRKLFGPETNRQLAYYEMREEFNRTTDRFRKSLIFVYLNRHCFNGLCRFNRSGKFNVPFGKYRSPAFPEREIRNFARRASGTEFVCQDFVTTLRGCLPGDVVYCDPPYVPLSKTASFTAYSTSDFSLQLQADLAREAQVLAARGIPVVLSNHNTELTRQLYAGADSVSTVDVQRFISCDGGNRGKAGEIIAVYNGS